MAQPNVRPSHGLSRVLDSVGQNIRILRENLAAFEPARSEPDPILPTGITRVVLRIFGRPIVCADCGRELFVGVPLVWRGQVWLIGASSRLIRVSFASSERIEFRHGQLDQCPSPERPWVC